MARPKMLSLNSIGMLLLTSFAVVFYVSGADVIRADDRGLSRVPSLEFFLFEQLYTVPGTNTTNIISSPPDGDVMALNWGNLAVSEQVVRARNDRASPVIGNSPALFYRNKRENNLSILKLITLNTDQYKGTIFTICDLSDFERGVEYAVAGGTGSFRDASGYALVNVVSQGPDHLTYRWQVYLSSCTRHPLMFPSPLGDDDSASLGLENEPRVFSS